MPNIALEGHSLSEGVSGSETHQDPPYALHAPSTSQAMVLGSRSESPRGNGSLDEATIQLLDKSKTTPKGTLDEPKRREEAVWESRQFTRPNTDKDPAQANTGKPSFSASAANDTQAPGDRTSRARKLINGLHARLSSTASLLNNFITHLRTLHERLKPAAPRASAAENTQPKTLATAHEKEHTAQPLPVQAKVSPSKETNTVSEIKRKAEAAERRLEGIGGLIRTQVDKVAGQLNSMTSETQTPQERYQARLDTALAGVVPKVKVPTAAMSASAAFIPARAQLKAEVEHGQENALEGTSSDHTQAQASRSGDTQVAMESDDEAQSKAAREAVQAAELRASESKAQRQQAGTLNANAANDAGATIWKRTPNGKGETRKFVQPARPVKNGAVTDPTHQRPSKAQALRGSKVIIKSFTDSER